MCCQCHVFEYNPSQLFPIDESKTHGFEKTKKSVFEPVATFIFVLIPWILRKYTKNFHCFFLFFVVYDIISKNLMGLVH